MAYIKLKVHYLSYYLIETQAEDSLSLKLYMSNFKDFTDRNAKIEFCKEVSYKLDGEDYRRKERLDIKDEAGPLKYVRLTEPFKVAKVQVVELVKDYDNYIRKIIDVKEKVKEMKVQRKRGGVILTDQDKIIYKKALKKLEFQLKEYKKELRVLVRSEF